MGKEADWVSESRAAELFACAPASLQKRREAGELPGGLCRKHPITGFVQYSTAKIQQMLDESVVKVGAG